MSESKDCTVEGIVTPVLLAQTNQM